MEDKYLDLTVVIPVHSTSDENFLEYFTTAIKSIASNDKLPKEVMIIRCACKDVKSTLDGLMKKGVLADYKDELNIRIIENEVGKSYPSMINEAAKQITTEWFSVLEFDDEYSSIYFKNFAEYAKVYDNVDLFLPLINEVDTEGKHRDITNAAVWSAGFNNSKEDLGMVLHEILMEFESISTNGMVIRTDVYKEVGGIKSTIKFAFNYEFLLRLTGKGIETMVIPKIGYKHVNMREGSLFWEYKNGEESIDGLEAQFWLSTARKEFRNDMEKVIEYNQVNNEEVNV